ncbi:hypothetical protein ANO11243_045130 [Dothideomycetidae sp. 11243]|nr:hypothetical protein ANO11243_045130 [fungal sp. No.11243]
MSVDSPSATTRGRLLGGKIPTARLRCEDDAQRVCEAKVCGDSASVDLSPAPMSRGLPGLSTPTGNESHQRPFSRVCRQGETSFSHPQAPPRHEPSNMAHAPRGDLVLVLILTALLASTAVLAGLARHDSVTSRPRVEPCSLQAEPGPRAHRAAPRLLCSAQQIELTRDHELAMVSFSPRLSRSAGRQTRVAVRLRNHR